jgi:hypothetical protein
LTSTPYLRVPYFVNLWNFSSFVKVTEASVSLPDSSEKYGSKFAVQVFFVVKAGASGRFGLTGSSDEEGLWERFFVALCFVVLRPRRLVFFLVPSSCAASWISSV